MYSEEIPRDRMQTGFLKQATPRHYNSYCAALMRLHSEKSEKHSMLESQDTEEAIVWW